MRFTTILFAGAFAMCVNAQSTTLSTTISAAAATATYSEDAAQASLVACVDACTPGDVSCTSKCITVPNPSNSQVNATNNCVADCPQGNGTATDNLNYANCVSGCIGKYYFTTGTPSATGNAGSAGSGSGAAATATAKGTGSSGTATGSTTAIGTNSAASGSATASATSKAAADALHVAGSAAGLLGFLAALLAI